MKRKFFTISALFGIFVVFGVQNLLAQQTPWTLSGNSDAKNTSKLGTTTSIALRLFTNNLERIRITKTGLVGIGTTAPSAQLHVVGNGYFTNGLSITGLVGIGTNTPSAQLHVVGNGYFTNGLSVNNGLSANSEGTGVYASGQQTGVFAVGSLYGIDAHAGSGAAAVGVWGSSDGLGYGVVGKTKTGTGVYGSTNGLNSYNDVVAGVYGECLGYGVGVRAFSSNGSGVFSYSTGTYAGYFSGDVYCSGMYLPSDPKLKKDILDLKSALDIINKLQPKIYEFRDDGNYKLMNLPKGKHYGLIAQNLEEVLPELVKTSEFNTALVKPSEKIEIKNFQSSGDSKLGLPQAQKPLKESSEIIDFKAVNYTELIPVLIKGMQELSSENKELRQQLNELNEIVGKLTQGQNTNSSAKNNTLLQNIPNPVKGSTIIKYNLSDGTKNAQLLITDNNGRTIQTIQLSTSGAISFDASTLRNGTYNYTLIINNKSVQSRQMIVVN